MVATSDEYATNTGLQILKKGGNAVDAAVGIAMVLAVTYPQAGNIGGGGFLIYRSADGETFALDYREKAPMSAWKDMYLDKNGDVIENKSLIGYSASGVPGTVAGLFIAHKRFGILTWEELIQPAINLAENGFIINRYISNSIKSNVKKLEKFRSSEIIFIPNGKELEEGERLIQKDLAKTLIRIRDKGALGFYSGETAKLIDRDMQANGGLISADDLKAYKPLWRKPVHFTYRGYEIYSMSPPSSGGIILAEILNSLENIDLTELSHNSANSIHFWVETEKQAYADRAEHLGDSDYYDVPIKLLISKKHGVEIFNRINPFKTFPSNKVHAAKLEHGETTHFSIVDSYGNAVSNTYTLNGSYGSGVVIKGTGILMNNEMDDFAIKPGFSNLYGLVGSEANSIETEKRMLSSMTPTIVTKNDSLYLITGSPGGAQIITTVAQVISNVIDHKMNIREAVEAPRFHHQWLPDTVYYEQKGFTIDVLNNLKNKGHLLKQTRSIGDVQAILWDGYHKEWTGWSDPRGNGLSRGF